MTRLTAAILFSMFAAQALASQANATEVPVLRPTTLVFGDLVRIGDLVDNVDSVKARIAVFRAPDLGETGTVSTRTVLEALRPHAVMGIDASGLIDVSVTRASRVVGAMEIRERIATIISEQMNLGDPANVLVSIESALPTLHLDPANTAPLAVARMTVDPRGGRFQIDFITGDAPLRVTGTASAAGDTVVLTRAIARGEILGEGDLAVEKRPRSQIKADSLQETAPAIGMAAQQAMRAGQIVRNADITRPQLVRRGEPVILVYEVPGIVLTARGKAEESGALGDTVNITNLQSKRIIQGTVTASGQVKVTSLTPRITTAAANHATVQTSAAR